jgi:diguanylate cyclase (GGDEF)-like protein
VSTQALLDAAFPFHLRVNEALVVTGFGRSLPLLCPEIAVGDLLSAHMWTFPGRSLLTSADLRLPADRALILQTRALEVRLRCQVLDRTDEGPDLEDQEAEGPSEETLLLATPWFDRLDDLDRTGLTLGDFAAHDPTPDFMFVSQGQLTSLNDARRLAERLRYLEAERRSQALQDPLTGLGNRRRFTEVLEENNPGTCLVIVDIDHFKEVNDTFGHPMGDAVLCSVAERLRALTTVQDSIIRLGGDEFAVLLHGEDSAARSIALAHAIVEAMRQPVRLEGANVSVSVSVGAVPKGDPHTLARNADVALYTAKRSGRSRAVMFDAALHEALLHRFELRDRLGYAIAEGAITVAYQPIVELSTGRVHGFEALARWTDPILGSVPPDVFIVLAEEAGLISELGMFILRQSAWQHGLWRREYPHADLVMSVNLSPRQLDDPHLVDQVRTVLTANDLPPHSLQLELTESAFTTHGGSTEQLHKIRALGMPLAIDDFGSSESTIARLHTVPATTLKIDRAFLSDLSDAPERSARLLQAVVAIADALGLSTVAEGIENERDLAVVTDAGCTFGQGYLYSRPMDEAAAAEYLAVELRSPDIPQPRIEPTARTLH